MEDSVPSDGVTSLANLALDIVAEKKHSKSNANLHEVDKRLVDIMHDAICLEQQSHALSVLVGLQKSGLSNRIIADLYFPEVARRLGENWCNDSVDFVRVTIGCARLRQMLPRLGQEWSTQPLVAPDAAKILVIVPEDAQHSLGATFVAGQLRRQRLSVTLSLGQNRNSLSETLGTRKFDGILISASKYEKFARIQQIVDQVSARQSDAKLIIGGGLIEHNDFDASAFGFDLATSDLALALSIIPKARQNMLVENLTNSSDNSFK